MIPVGLSVPTPLTRLFVIVVVAAAIVVAWRALHPRSAGWVMSVARGWVRYRLVYWPRWTAVMIGCGLTRPGRDGDRRPIISRVRSTKWADAITVAVPAGMTPADVAAHTDELAHALGGINARVTPSRPGRAVITVIRRDALDTPVPAFPIPETEEVDAEALPVAVTDMKETYRLPLLYAHVLVAGATGAGKGSVLWSTVRAVCPLIPTGVVQLWGIDPKGGVELTMGAALFDRLAYDNGDPDAPGRLVELMEDAATLVRTRAARIAGKSRKHAPTPVEPHIVVLVDELAFLTAYQPDGDLRKRFTAALSVVLTMGRAVAVTVAAFLQDPRKETIPARPLFPVKIALRLDSTSESKMVLGEPAHNLGARCEHIPRSLPGVGYAIADGQPAPVRIRFGYPTDTDIHYMQTHYPAPRPAERTTTATTVPRTLTAA